MPVDARGLSAHVLVDGRAVPELSDPDTTPRDWAFLRTAATNGQVSPEAAAACAQSKCLVATTAGTRLEVHVGSLCPGDVLEARLLATACDECAASGAGLEMRCVVHEGRDHCLAAALRDSGELNDVLVRLVGSADRSEQAALPDGFVGFEGCEDF